MLEERRNDVETKLIRQEILNLSKSYEKGEEAALEWRNRFCEKLDRITDRLNLLPCKQAEEVVRGVKSDVTWLQRGAVGIIAVLFAMGVAWGTLANTVSVNTRKWERLEPEHQEIIKDVGVLKEKTHSEKAAQDGKLNRVGV